MRWIEYKIRAKKSLKVEITGKKCGFIPISIDCNGNYLIKPKYRHVERFKGQYVKLGNESDFGLYDENGVHLAEVIEPMLEEEETISQYSVDYAEIFDSPSKSIYYFVIAYVEDGVLECLTYEIKEEEI